VRLRPQRLVHRLGDDADWWCWPIEERFKELRERNAVFLDLGSDGIYSGEVVPYGLETPVVEATLEVESGRVFVGAAEEVTSEGLEPECTRGGMFVSLTPGVYLLQARRSGTGIIQLHFKQQSPGEYVVPQSLPQAL